MRKLILMALLVALAIPAAAIAAGTPAQNAAAQATCRAQRSQIGAAAFKLLYAPTANANQANAFGKCVSGAVKSEQANAAAAVASCKAAQAADRAAFKTQYGSFGKCISAKTSAADKAHQAATIAAAKSCKTERAAGVAAFTTKYGTGSNKSDAFGKCVAGKVKTTS
ncbi:MAG TPA: hypothetical protein VGP69_03815 [Gaiellaceae bacterium]|jgi:hypothetical protein|nr:hypothetical protein [Gaiellaceae bacterium]